MAIMIIIKRMIEMRMIREIIMMTRHRWRVNGPPIRSFGQKQRSHDLRQVIIINISIIHHQHPSYQHHQLLNNHHQHPSYHHQHLNHHLQHPSYGVRTEYLRNEYL